MLLLNVLHLNSPRLLIVSFATSQSLGKLHMELSRLRILLENLYKILKTRLSIRFKDDF